MPSKRKKETRKMAKGVMKYNPETMKMEEVSSHKATNNEPIRIPDDIFITLKNFAKADGIDLSGVSFVTVKTADGKTKKDKDGKPVFVMEDGKKLVIPIVESTAKAHSAVREYIVSLLMIYIAGRKAREAKIVPLVENTTDPS